MSLDGGMGHLAAAIHCCRSFGFPFARHVSEILMVFEASLWENPTAGYHSLSRYWMSAVAPMMGVGD